MTLINLKAHQRNFKDIKDHRRCKCNLNKQLHRPSRATLPFRLLLKHHKTIAVSRAFQVHHPQILTYQSLLQVLTNNHNSFLHHLHRAISNHKYWHNSNTSKLHQVLIKLSLRIHSLNSCHQHHSKFNRYPNPHILRRQARFKGTKPRICIEHNPDLHHRLSPS